MDWFTSLDAHWIWLTVGVLLAAAEMAVSGVYLIWLAAAAIVTGIITWATGASVEVQLVEFVALSLIAVFSARRHLRDKPIESADPLMNKRGARLVGEVATVTQAIEDGSGRVHHGDSEWIARGVDVPAGAKVRITGSDGAVLLVEPLAQITGPGGESGAPLG